MCIVCDIKHTKLNYYISVCLSVYLSIHPSIRPPIHPSIHQSIDPSIHFLLSAVQLHFLKSNAIHLYVTRCPKVFKKIQALRQTFRRWKRDIEQVLGLGPTNIRRHDKECIPGTRDLCTPLCYILITTSCCVTMNIYALANVVAHPNFDDINTTWCSCCCRYISCLYQDTSNVFTPDGRNVHIYVKRTAVHFILK
jgi:hypothetical protein